MTRLSDEDFALPEDVPTLFPETYGAARLKPPQTVKQQSIEQGQRALPGAGAAFDDQIKNLTSRISGYGERETELSKPADYSQLQDYARQRSQSFLPMALSAALLGRGPQGTEGLAKLASQQAGDAFSPIKVEGGQIDANGNLVMDPGFHRTKELEAIRAHIIRLEAQKATVMSAQEKLRLDNESKLWQQKYQQGMLDSRNEANEIRRDLGTAMLDVRRDAAGAAAGARNERAADRATAQKFTQSQTLSKEYDKRVGAFSGGLSAAQNLVQLASSPDAATNPQTQIAMVFAFGKMLDPESVVREGEYKLFSEARGWLESLQVTPDRIMAGVRMSPQQLQRMAQTAQQIMTSAGGRKQALQSYYNDKASRWQLNPSDVMPDYSPQLQAPGAPGAPAPAPAPGGAPAGGGSAIQAEIARRASGGR